MHRPARIDQNGAGEGNRHGRHVGQKLPSAVRHAQWQRRPLPLSSSNRPHACSNRLLQPATALHKREGQSVQQPYWARHAGEFSTAKEAGSSMRHPCRHRGRCSRMPAAAEPNKSRAASSALVRRHAECQPLCAAARLHFLQLTRRRPHTHCRCRLSLGAKGPAETSAPLRAGGEACSPRRRATSAVCRLRVQTRASRRLWLRSGRALAPGCSRLVAPKVDKDQLTAEGVCTPSDSGMQGCSLKTQKTRALTNLLPRCRASNAPTARRLA
jgi:hypothetical protein